MHFCPTGMNSSVAAVSAGGMIMTNSSMGSMGNMAGGGLVVSSSVNKQTLTNTTSMMTPGQSHLPANHAVPQVCVLTLFIKVTFFCLINTMTVIGYDKSLFK